MELAGVILGAPHHKRGVAHGSIQMGTLDYNKDNNITCHAYMPPASYDDFVQDLIGARERGGSHAWMHVMTLIKLHTGNRSATEVSDKVSNGQETAMLPCLGLCAGSNSRSQATGGLRN